MNFFERLKNEKTGFILLFVISVISILVIMMSPSISQNQSYHEFCDSAKLFGIPNFWNVMSNLPFTVVGILGLINKGSVTKLKLQYIVLFAGIIFISMGSGYYHLYPKDSALVWDRLPMTIVFMSLFSIIISEFINPNTGRKMLIPLLILGVLSVIYWVVYDGLKFYALIQFFPMLSIPVILLFFKSSYNKVYGYWLLLLAYVLAKLCEYLDTEILILLKVVSGHTLKHLIAAFGLFILYDTYNRRNAIQG